MASKYYWDYHNIELQKAMKKLFPKKRYVFITDAEERKVKKYASSLIKERKIKERKGRKK